MKKIKGFYEFITEETDGSTSASPGSGTAVGGGAEGSFVPSAGVSIGGGDSASSFNVGSSGNAYGSLSNISGMGGVVSPQPSNKPGDVAGSTKGSGDISKGGMTFTKQFINRKKRKHTKDKKERNYFIKATKIDDLKNIHSFKSFSGGND